jgi:predicted lipoprotein with Yx(FWY)xxD motif
MRLFALLIVLLLLVTPAFAQDAGVLQVANHPTLGTIVVAPNGMTLYTFSNDTPGVSNCVGACLDLWPAYTVDATVALVAPSVPGEIGVIAQADGRLHITLNGLPLYFYASDAAPGDATGQGVGDVWFVVPVVAAAPSAASEFLLNASLSRDLGSILTASTGMTLYIFTNDTPGVSNCIAQCLETWPAFTVDAAATLNAVPGIGGTISVLQRPDGLSQVMLDNRPLYFFAGDTQPGDVTGQGVGDVWFVVPLDAVRVANVGGRSLLVDAAGKTLYTYANDEFNWSNCVGDCITNWPPLAFSAEQPIISANGISGALALSQRADGLFHVTFNGRPLYTFVNDAVAGDVNGDGAGGVWAAVPVTPVVQVGGNAALGSFAADLSGRTLYTFANDVPDSGSSACVDGCAANWPPLTIPSGAIPVAQGALPGTLGTITRADGSLQVTHDGRPLYTFVNDARPGDANGNGAGDGVWGIIPLASFPFVPPTTCEVTPVNANANLRAQPSVNSANVRSVNQGDVLVINGQTVSEGFVWWQLTTGEWVRSDVVVEITPCAAMPTISGVSVPAPAAAQPAAPAPVVTPDPFAPAGTQEPGG